MSIAFVHEGRQWAAGVAKTHYSRIAPTGSMRKPCRPRPDPNTPSPTANHLRTQTRLQGPGRIAGRWGAVSYMPARCEASGRFTPAYRPLDLQLSRGLLRIRTGSIMSARSTSWTTRSWVDFYLRAFGGSVSCSYVSPRVNCVAHHYGTGFRSLQWRN